MRKAVYNGDVTPSLMWPLTLDTPGVELKNLDRVKRILMTTSEIEDQDWFRLTHWLRTTMRCFWGDKVGSVSSDLLLVASNTHTEYKFPRWRQCAFFVPLKMKFSRRIFYIFYHKKCCKLYKSLWIKPWGHVCGMKSKENQKINTHFFYDAFQD